MAKNDNFRRYTKSQPKGQLPDFVHNTKLDDPTLYIPSDALMDAVKAGKNPAWDAEPRALRRGNP